MKGNKPGAEARSPIDWPDVRARLERSRQALEAGRERSPDEVSRILRERAQSLARPVEEAVPAATDMLDLTVFSLSGERFGIDAAHVHEVFALRELTPVPCTPPFVLGVVNHRGRILAVLDLRRLFELEGQGFDKGSRIIAVEAGGMAFGILADAVEGAVGVGAHEVMPPPPALTANHLIRGVTRELVVLLDLSALAGDPRITLDAEAG